MSSPSTLMYFFCFLDVSLFVEISMFLMEEHRHKHKRSQVEDNSTPSTWILKLFLNSMEEHVFLF
jgi:hypothetical protein